MEGMEGGVQRGPSEHRERKKGGTRTEAHPTNPLSLVAHALHPPSCTASPCRKLQCASEAGAPIVSGPVAEEKGPLVVNNSAVHSDHNGGTSHCFEHLFGVGVGPLAARQR